MVAAGTPNWREAPRHARIPIANVIYAAGARWNIAGLPRPVCRRPDPRWVPLDRDLIAGRSGWPAIRTVYLLPRGRSDRNLGDPARCVARGERFLVGLGDDLIGRQPLVELSTPVLLLSGPGWCGDAWLRGYHRAPPLGETPSLQQSACRSTTGRRIGIAPPVDRRPEPTHSAENLRSRLRGSRCLDGIGPSPLVKQASAR